MITNRIYSYYSNIGWEAQAEVAELWRERWRMEGWDPIILGPKDAQKDRRWDAMQKKCEAFPCRKGARTFERACLERWLAFAGIKDPGPATDFDVFPIRPFPPRNFGSLPVSGDGSSCPGFIVGSGADFSKIADAILKYEPEPDDVWDGKPHVCDMSIMRKRQNDLYRIQVMVITFLQHNWGTTPLMHYGNDSISKVEHLYPGHSKAQIIRKLLLQHYKRE